VPGSAGRPFPFSRTSRLKGPVRCLAAQGAHREATALPDPGLPGGVLGDVVRGHQRRRWERKELPSA